MLSGSLTHTASAWFQLVKGLCERAIAHLQRSGEAPKEKVLLKESIHVRE